MSVVEIDIQTMAETFRDVVGICPQRVGESAHSSETRTLLDIPTRLCHNRLELAAFGRDGLGPAQAQHTRRSATVATDGWH